MTDFAEAAQILQQPGAVVVIPTDTVYGLATRAADPEAVERLYQLKKRDAKPGTIIAANIDQLESLGLKRRYLTAVEQFWPGAVSVVIPCADPVLKYLHRGQMSLAVRLPEPADLRELLQQTGPLVTTSANDPGEPTAANVTEARAYFGDQVDTYIDGGDLSNHQPSTIIRIVDDAIEVLRPGVVDVKPNE
ncbi:MAG TPA: L-threonylcarbamoyladenylate synthase [Candidatus Saccharimonadales bacterium]|nr:L-threonylcarbamoyladenylate synthase [Candidatus Saccharimonadales bacterium]